MARTPYSAGGPLPAGFVPGGRENGPESFLKNDKPIGPIDLNSIKGGEAESFLKNQARTVVLAAPAGDEPQQGGS